MMPIIPTTPQQTTQNERPIVVIGAGAVGCYHAGLIALSGQRVLLIAKPLRAKALQEKGLVIQWLTHQQTIPIEVSADITRIREAQQIIICVKSHQTEALANTMLAHLRPDCVILSMQNGLQNTARLSTQLRRPIFITMIYVALSMLCDHVVSYQGGGPLILGQLPSDPSLNSTNTHANSNPTPNPSDADLEGLVNLLVKANIPVSVSSDILQDLWSKWILNCVYNGLSALGPINYGELVRVPGILDLIQAITEECFALARAENISLNEASITEQIARIPVICPLQKSSMAQDIETQRPTEILELNGLAVLKGQALAIPTPLNALITSLIQMQESLYPT